MLVRSPTWVVGSMAMLAALPKLYCILSFTGMHMPLRRAVAAPPTDRLMLYVVVFDVLGMI